MFANFGRAVSLLRELRGQTQAQLARAAGMGKAQLSKYENGRELPKLETLERLLGCLQVGQLEFFYVITQLDAVQAGLDSTPPRPEEMLLRGGRLLEAETDRAFRTLLEDLLVLYRRLLESQGGGICGPATLEAKLSGVPKGEEDR